MTVVKYGSEALLLRKKGERHPRFFPEKRQTDFMDTRLIERISNSRLYEISGLFLLYKVIMREKLRW